ncbi:MAG: hypothetical protein AAFO77_10130 [Pseudomonadota bacterium]
MSANLVNQIVECLAAAEIGLALVERAADLASIDRSPRAVPAAYVFIVEEASSENENATGGAGGTQAVQQLTQVDIAVLIITANKVDANGAAAATDIDALKAKVRSTLLGRVLTGADVPLEHVSGRMVSMVRSFVTYEDIFATATTLEGPLTDG